MVSPGMLKPNILLIQSVRVSQFHSKHSDLVHWFTLMDNKTCVNDNPVMLPLTSHY